MSSLRQLTGQQLRVVLEHAQQLRARSREQFLQSLATRLDGADAIGDGDLARALKQTLREMHIERRVR